MINHNMLNEYSSQITVSDNLIDLFNRCNNKSYFSMFIFQLVCLLLHDVRSLTIDLLRIIIKQKQIGA